jgi:hypothetical protein
MRPDRQSTRQQQVELEVVPDLRQSKLDPRPHSGKGNAMAGHARPDRSVTARARSGEPIINIALRPVFGQTRNFFTRSGVDTALTISR